MRRPRQSLPGPSGPILLALLVVVPVPSRAEHQWRRVETPYFTLFSAAHPDDVSREAHQLESMAHVLEHLGLGAPVGCRPKTVLVAFPDRKTLNARPSPRGRPTDVVGYCVHLPFGHWIGFVGSEEDGRIVARHEFAHTVTSDVFWRVPPCLSEGLAELLSTFQMKDTHAEFGHPLALSRLRVQYLDLYSLDELFGVSSAALDSLDTESRAVFYAESWALVHYLARDGFDALFRFAQALANGEKAKGAFERAFPSEDWAATPRRLKSYVEADVERHHRVRTERVALPSASASAIREVSSAEVHANVGLWRMYSDDPTWIEESFDQALRDAPGLGLALAGKGLIALTQRRYEAAEENLRRASVDSSNAQVLFISGVGLRRLAFESGRAGRGGLGEEAFHLLKRSVALDSTDANALAWYARAGFEHDDNSEHVIRALRRASVALRSDPILATDLASILVRMGEVEGAREALSMPVRVPGTTERVHSGAMSPYDSLITIYNRAVVAANEGEFGRASRLFERVAAASEGEMRDSAQMMVRLLRGSHEYSMGLKAVKSGDLAGAIVWFEKAAGLATNESTRKRAAQYVKDLRSTLKSQKSHPSSDPKKRQ